jgi:hypothetical protein
MLRLIFALAVTVLLCTAQPIKWEEHEPVSPEDKLAYKKLYQLDRGPGVCQVWWKRSGGVRLEAIDARIFPDGAVARKTTVEITKRSNGNTTVETSHSKQLRINGSWEKDSSLQGDDFQGMCAPEAHRLSAQVQASFFGYYGLGTKPRKK